MMRQVHEIVYAKYDDDGWWYLAEVVSIVETSRQYNIHYMDGDDRSHVPEKELSKVPARERNDPMVGKTFFEPGDYKPGVKVKTTDVKRGEFRVLCKQPGGKSPTYWCERMTNCCGEKREIVEITSWYVKDRVDKYSNE